MKVSNRLVEVLAHHYKLKDSAGFMVMYRRQVVPEESQRWKHVPMLWINSPVSLRG